MDPASAEELRQKHELLQHKFNRDLTTLRTWAAEKGIDVKSVDMFKRHLPLMYKAAQHLKEINQTLESLDFVFKTRDFETQKTIADKSPDEIYNERKKQLDGLRHAVGSFVRLNSILTKLNTYLLADDNERGAAKARWFREALGFTRQNIRELVEQIRFDAARETFKARRSIYGFFFNQSIPIKGANGKVIDVTFVWRVDHDGYLYLITSLLGTRK